MASEDEDLLEDSNFKDLGELEDLDDDAENALLGDSDEEGANSRRDRALSLMSSNSNQHRLYSGDNESETEDVEEGQEQEFEYVDEEGNPVEVGYNDDVEYVEVSQDDTEQSRMEESANEFVLDLVVDPDLEFDDSGVQDAKEESLSSSTTKLKNTSLPSTGQIQSPKEDRRRLPQQRKSGEVRHESQREPNQRQQQLENRRQQQQQQQKQQQQLKKREDQQRIREQQKQHEQQEQQKGLRQQKQQQFVNTRSSSSENEKSTENEDYSFKQEENYDSAVDNEENYNTSIKNESSESEDEEESGRGRFRTERSNVISVSTAKKRPNIPDSLEAVISHEEAARLERSNRQQLKRPWHRGGYARDMPRERDRNRDRDRDNGRSRDHDRNYKDGSSPRQQEIGHGNLAHFQPHVDSAPLGLQDSDSSTNSEHKASRKILINPHFKGSIVPASEALPKTSYAWDNQPVNVGIPSDHSSAGSSEFHYMSHRPESENHFGASFSTQHNNNLLNMPNAPQNPIGQFHFNQPPPIKHNTTFHGPPPTVPNFPNRPPPLMSIPPLLPPTNNHLSSSVNHFPPREPAFEAKAHELQQVQFQSSNESWTHGANQHNFKPYNVPPLNQGFPPIPQNAEQPPSFPNVQQPPPPIQRSDFQHQLVPPAGPPPTFNRPPPGFDINVRLGGPPPPRPMLTTWPTQQQPQRPQPPMLLPVFNRPPPPVSIASHQNNFQISSLPPSIPLMNRPVHTSMNEQGLGNVNQFTQPGIRHRQPFTPAGQNTNLRSLPQHQHHHHEQQQQQQKPQQSWSSSNLRPIAQQKQPPFGKRLRNESISSLPLKQIRTTNKPVLTNRRMPQVNTNIRQVEIVDKLPATEALPLGLNRKKNSSQQASNLTQCLTVSSNVLKNTEEKVNLVSSEEDEETRRYREQIELQKKKREEVLRMKEQRRILMAHERRKQMLQQEQPLQNQNQEGMPIPESSKGTPSSSIQIVPIKPSTTSVNQMVSNQGDFACIPENAQTEGTKKRVVFFRRVVTRPFTNMRRPVLSSLRTVTNAGRSLGPVPFTPHLQQGQKDMIQRLPHHSHSQEATTTAFSNNSNLTNITLQSPIKHQSINHAGAPQQVTQPLQQPERQIQHPGNQPLQTGQPYQQPRGPGQQQEKQVHQPVKQFQPAGRPQQQFRGPQKQTGVPQQQQQTRMLQQHSGGPIQHPGGQQQQIRGPQQQIRGPQQQIRGPQQQIRGPQQQIRGPQQQIRGPQQQIRGPQQQSRGPQQQSRGPPQQPGRPIQLPTSNAVSKPIVKMSAAREADVNRPRQMMTTEVGVVNVSPDMKLRAADSGTSNRVVINSNKRTLPAGSAQPPAKRISAEVAVTTGATQNATMALPQTQQQAPSVSGTSKVQIENLAQATSDLQLRKLCQSIGPVESLNLYKDQRRALVKFKNVQHAKEFMNKYQRRMVDLSLIAISLVS